MDIKAVTAHTVLTAAIAAGTFLVAPAAHATASCTAPSGVLNLRASGGYDVAVDANGSALGPTAVIRTPDGVWNANVLEGGITGRTIVANLGFSGSKAYVHFEGTVGADGNAHGTASGLANPVNLPEGTWDTTGPLTCG